jgi:hypothetical protein
VRRLHFENPEEVAPHPSHIPKPNPRITQAWLAGARWALGRLGADRESAETVMREINAIEEQAEVQRSQRPKRPTMRRGV